MSLLKPISPLGPTLQPTRQLFHHLLKLKLQLLSSPHPTSNLTEKFSRSVRFLSTPCQRIHPLSTPTLRCPPLTHNFKVLIQLSLLRSKCSSKPAQRDLNCCSRMTVSPPIWYQFPSDFSPSLMFGV